MHKFQYSSSQGWVKVVRSHFFGYNLVSSSQLPLLEPQLLPASKLFLWGDGWSRQLEPPGGPEGEDPLHLAQTRQGPQVGVSKDSQSVNHIPHFYAGLIVVLFLYGGSNLGSGLGPDLLRTQCFLILSLSVNKITECFDKAVHEGDDCDVCLLPPAHPTPRPS